jgi:predicted nucleic acid-binding protein
MKTTLEMPDELFRRAKTNPLTEAQGEKAAALAAQQFLRGAHAVYVALAKQLGAPLVTWDKELLERAAAVVPTLTPSEWLRRNPGE